MWPPVCGGGAGAVLPVYQGPLGGDHQTDTELSPLREVREFVTVVYLFTRYV